MLCSKCHNSKDFYIRTETETYTVKGEEITIDANVTYCKHCGAKVWNSKLDSDNLNKAYTAHKYKYSRAPINDIKPQNNNSKIKCYMCNGDMIETVAPMTFKVNERTATLNVTQYICKECGYSIVDDKEFIRIEKELGFTV